MIGTRIYYSKVTRSRIHFAAVLIALLTLQCTRPAKIPPLPLEICFLDNECSHFTSILDIVSGAKITSRPTLNSTE